MNLKKPKMKTPILKTLLFSFIWMSLSNLFCQNNIEISIFDENRNPVHYANIALFNQTDSLVAGAYSNNGIASFNNIRKNDYKLCVRYFGYQDSCVFINHDGLKDLKITIDLTPSVTSLDAITVKAAKPTIKVNSNNNISVNIENTQLQEEESVSEIFKYLPGVIATSDGLKLFGSSDFIYMINGKEVISQQEIEVLKPEDIKEIEIITSNAKLDATKKAAINIKTIKRRDFFGAQIKDVLQYNRAFGNFLDLYLTFNTNKVQQSLMYNNELGGSKSTENSSTQIYINPDDIYKVAFYAERFDKFNYNNLFYAINYDIDTNQYVGLQLSGSFSKPKSIYDIENTILDTNFYATDRLDIGQVYHFQSSANYFYKTKKSGEFSFVADFYLKNTKSNMDVTENDENFFINSDNKFKIYALTGDYNFPISKIKTTATVGFKLYRTDNNNTNTTSGTFADNIFSSNNYLIEQSAAAFVQFKTSVKKISFGGGLRFEYYYHKVKDHINHKERTSKKPDLFPNLSFTYNISSKHILMLNYSKNINRQSYNFISGQNSYVNPYCYKVGNVNLKPEIINSVSLSYIFAGLLQIDARYSNSKNYTTLVSLPSDSIVIVSFDNFAKQDIILGVSFTKEGKRHYTSVGVNLGKSFIDYPNVLNTLKLPKINFHLSANNTFNITNNFSSVVSFTYHPKIRYDFELVKPEFYVFVGVRHTFFKKSLRLGIYYQYQSIKKFMREYDNIYTDDAFTYSRHMVTFSVSYKFRFNQKWIDEKNAISSEKQRAN
jgi:hypothetical protein